MNDIGRADPQPHSLAGLEVQPVGRKPAQFRRAGDDVHNLDAGRRRAPGLVAEDACREDNEHQQDNAQSKHFPLHPSLAASCFHVYLSTHFLVFSSSHARYNPNSPTVAAAQNAATGAAAQGD